MAAKCHRQDEGEAHLGLGGQCCGGLRIPVGQLLLLDRHLVIRKHHFPSLMIPILLVRFCRMTLVIGRFAYVLTLFPWSMPFKGYHQCYIRFIITFHFMFDRWIII